MRFLSGEQPPDSLLGLKEWLTRLVININASLQSTQYQYDTVIITDKFTTKSKQVIICKNTVEINVALDPKPDTGTEVFIKNMGSDFVNVVGTINGTENIILNFNGTTVHLYYTGQEWISL